jgi:hypothetical protein
MLGYVEVDDPSAVMSEHDEDEEHSQARAGNGEEVERDEVPDMVAEKCPPGLGWRSAPVLEQAADGAFRDVDAELQELPVDSGSTPQRIGRGHGSDQRLDRVVDGRAISVRPTGQPGPVLAEATSLPPQDGVRGHDREGPFPPRPHPDQRDPEEAVRSA